MSRQLFLCQCTVALSALRVGGNYMCKLFDMFLDGRSRVVVVLMVVVVVVVVVVAAAAAHATAMLWRK